MLDVPQPNRLPAATVILVGGSVRAAAEDAAAAGYRVVAIDRFGDRDLKSVCQSWHCWEPHGDLVSLIERWPAAPIVPTGGFTGCAIPPFHSNRLIAFPTAATFAAISDPAQLRELALRCKIGFPQTIPGEAVRCGKSPPGPGDWLVKPRIGTGGLGIRRWRSCEETSGAETSGAESKGETLGPQEDLQQYVAGRSLGVNFFSRVAGGQRKTWLLGAFRSITHRKNRTFSWLYGGSLGPLPMSPERHELLSCLGAEIASTFKIVGLFNVDLIEQPNRSLVLLEINPRYSASMELMVERRGNNLLNGRSLIDAHLAAYLEVADKQADRSRIDARTSWLTDFSPLASHNSEQTPWACKRIVYAREPLAADQLPRILEQVRAAELGMNQIGFHDLPTLDTAILAGHPVLTLIVRGATSAAITKTARRIERQIRQACRV